MELTAWELSLDINESLLIGIQKQNFVTESSHEEDYSICILCFRIRLTLIYKQYYEKNS